MRKISANLILPVDSAPLKNGIVQVDHGGRILEMIDTGGRLSEEAGLEFYPGIIIPGFVLPWLRLENGPDNTVERKLESLNNSLFRHGFKGLGLVLGESVISDKEFEIMAASRILYHPVIELCPGPDEDGYTVLNRGIDMISRAWNEYGLSCSLSIHAGAGDNSDLAKLLAEYCASHRNLIPPDCSEYGSDNKAGASHPHSLDILAHMRSSSPRKAITEILPKYTLEAARKIFEDDDLGSLSPGKKPGLNLITGIRDKALLPHTGSMVKVLI